MIYIVLGFGFSGTTLVSELMHHSGIRMIDQDRDQYDHGGKYEHPDFQNINKEILKLNDDRVAHLRPSDCPEDIDNSLKDRMLALIERQNSKYENWGFKDPRTVVTYPLWRELLPEHRTVVIFRDPSSTWHRHRWRGFYKRYANAWFAYQQLRQWWEYNNIILQYRASMLNSSLLINYEELMSGEVEFKRLAQFVGYGLLDKRRAYMHRRTGSDILFRCVRSVMNKYSNYCIDAMWGKLLQERKLEISEG